MVIEPTVWSVSCLLFFYSRCPPCPTICKSGGGARAPRPMESAPLMISWTSLHYAPPETVKSLRRRSWRVVSTGNCFTDNNKNKHYRKITSTTQQAKTRKRMYINQLLHILTYISFIINPLSPSGENIATKYWGILGASWRRYCRLIPYQKTWKPRGSYGCSYKRIVQRLINNLCV